MPSPVRPHACDCPALMLWKVSPPATRVGVRRSVVVPSPSCPLVLSPQQYGTPAAVRPQLYSATVGTETLRKESPPSTATGAAFTSERAPFPSWPWALYPQQYAAPVVATAQL